MPTLPQLTPVHTRLAALAGAWSGTEELAASPWSSGGPAHGRHVFAPSAGGFAVVQDYVEHRDGSESLNGHGVLTVEPDTQEVLWFWFDSIGFPPAAPSRGGFDEAGTTLTLTKTTPRGTQRATFALDGDRLHHRVEARLGEATDFATLVAATYERERG